MLETKNCDYDILFETIPNQRWISEGIFWAIFSDIWLSEFYRNFWPYCWFWPFLMTFIFIGNNIWFHSWCDLRKRPSGCSCYAYWYSCCGKMTYINIFSLDIFWKLTNLLWQKLEALEALWLIRPENLGQYRCCQSGNSCLVLFRQHLKKYEIFWALLSRGICQKIESVSTHNMLNCNLNILKMAMSLVLLFLSCFSGHWSTFLVFLLLKSIFYKKILRKLVLTQNCKFCPT